MFVLSMLVIKKALATLKLESFEGTAINMPIREYMVTVQENGALVNVKMRAYRLPDNDRWKYKIHLADGTVLDGIAGGGTELYSERASVPIASIRECRRISNSLFTEEELEELDD